MATKEGRAEGGLNQSQKVYYCGSCGSVCSGNRFVEAHLANECKGQTRKTAAATKRNAHRLEEAILNTKEWKAQRVQKEANAALSEFKSNVIRDIESLREVNRQVVEDMLRNYWNPKF